LTQRRGGAQEYVVLTKRIKARYGKKQMSKKAAKHHRKASEHYTHAARHHGEAAKQHEVGLHEKAAHHAHTARAHVIRAKGHAEEAAKAHADKFRQDVKDFWSEMDQRKVAAVDKLTPMSNMPRKRSAGAANPKKRSKS
jgi:hypothetical protein